MSRLPQERRESESIGGPLPTRVAWRVCCLLHDQAPCLRDSSEASRDSYHLFRQPPPRRCEALDPQFRRRGKRTVSIACHDCSCGAQSLLTAGRGYGAWSAVEIPRCPLCGPRLNPTIGHARGLGQNPTDLFTRSTLPHLASSRAGRNTCIGFVERHRSLQLGGIRLDRAPVFWSEPVSSRRHPSEYRAPTIRAAKRSIA